MSDWLDVLQVKKSVDELPSLLPDTAAQFDAFLKAEPLTEQRVLAILQRHIGGPKRADTWDTMLTGLKYCLGDDVTYMLAWLIQDGQTAEKFAQLGEHASPAVMSFFRTIFGVYGGDMQLAYEGWNELPNNWNAIAREVLYDQLSRIHRLVIRITKYNGEEIFVEGPPNSIVGLTCGMLTTLRFVGQPDVFRDTAVENLLDEAAQLITFFGKKDRMIELLQAQEQAPMEQEQAPAER